MKIGMLCVTSVQYMVFVNGLSVGLITPSRGLRQGDSLSAYLFLLCVEGPSYSLNNATTNERINSSRVSATSPAITHLLFDDISFFFFKENMEEAENVKNLLNLYG